MKVHTKNSATDKFGWFCGNQNKDNAVNPKNVLEKLPLTHNDWLDFQKCIFKKLINVIFTEKKKSSAIINNNPQS